jgi:hypothetical protein
MRTARVMAIRGLISKGTKKLPPSVFRFTPEGEATNPAPISAPVSAWVVETGSPNLVAVSP